MKRSQYCRVFRRIQWEQDKIGEIEAMLRQPASSAERHRHSDALEVIPMKISRIPAQTRKFPPAAAIVTVGLMAVIGIGAAFWLTADDPIQPQDSQGASMTDSPTAPDDPVEPVTYKVVADNIEGDLQTKFNGADDMPSMSLHSYHAERLMEAENGCYFIQNIYAESSSKPDYMQLCYRDAATGETVVVCAKPDCTHNNEYCVASNTKYQGVPSVYYENYLYGIAYNTEKMQDYNPFESVDEDNDNVPDDFSEYLYGEITLMRYAPDGTELTALCSLENVLSKSLDGCSFSDVSIIGHKGALWIGIVFKRGIFDNNHVNNLAHDLEDYDRGCGYAVLHYDLSSGALTSVLSMDITEGCNASAPKDLCGVGDYVYFRKSNTDWADPYNGDRLYRANIRTGVVEDVLHEVAGYAICGDTVFYLKEGAAEGGGQLFSVEQYDLVTGEKSQFLDKNNRAWDVQCSKDYVCIVRGQRNAEWYEEPYLSIYDRNGTLLTTAPLLYDIFPNSNETGISVRGDCLYAVGYATAYTASISEIIETGKVDLQVLWERIVVMEEDS